MTETTTLVIDRAELKKRFKPLLRLGDVILLLGEQGITKSDVFKLLSAGQIKATPSMVKPMPGRKSVRAYYSRDQVIGLLP